MISVPGVTGVWGPILLAIGWLLVALIFKYSGYKKMKKGLEWWGAGIASLMLWGAFEVLYAVFAHFNWAIYIEYIGIYVGGILAWIFGLIGAVVIIQELLK